MKRAAIIAIAVLFFIAALGLTFYPIISNYFNTLYASEIQTSYEAVIEEADNRELIAAKEAAVAYNESITPGATMADAYSQEALIAASKDYDTLLNLAGDGLMGYIEIPKINVDLPIYHGTADDTLERGVGHLLGSSLPVGGEYTHTILAGHSGLATQKMFTDLPQLAIGDIFYMKILNETLAYQVYFTDKVLPHDTSHLQLEAGRDLCTLVTCVPIGVNTHRLLVMAERIPYEEAEVIVETTQEEVIVESTWEQHYLKGIFIGLGVVFAFGLISLIVWRVRRRSYESR